MIGIEAFRAAIGSWYFKSPLRRKSKEMNCNSDIEDNTSICFTLFIRLVLFGSVAFAINTATIANSKLNQESETSFLPIQVLQTQLVIGNVEKNPGPKNNLCDFCGACFERKSNLKRHINTRHMNNVAIRCRICGTDFNQLDQWKKHMNDIHKPVDDKWIKIKDAFEDRVLEIAHIYGQSTLEEALGNNILESVLDQIRYYIRLFGQIRYCFNFGALMRRQGIEEEIEETFYFSSPAKSAIFGEFNLADDVEKEFKILRERVLDMNVEHEGSGWSFINAEVLTITITKLNTHGMGSHINFQPRNKNGNLIKALLNNTINVKNRDNKCVLYNIVLSAYSNEIQGDPSNPANLEEFLSRINTRGVDFPVTEADLSILEHINRKTLNIAIHVWRYVHYDHIEPFYISRNKSKNRTECDMLLVDGKSIDGQNTQHLIHIKDRAAVFRKSLARSQQRKMRFFCSSCQLFRSDSAERMDRHHKMCKDQEYVKAYYPPQADAYTPYEGNIIRPPNSYRTSLPVLRGIFDFETAHIQEPQESCSRCFNIMNKLSSKDIESFICPHTKKTLSYTSSSLPPICFSLIMINNKNEKVFEKFHVGTNSAEYLIKLLVKKQEEFMKYIDQNMEMNMTKIDKWRFNKSTHCKSCNKKFDENVVKTRDHDHFTGVENI